MSAGEEVPPADRFIIKIFYINIKIINLVVVLMRFIMEPWAGIEYLTERQLQVSLLF